MSLGVLRPCSDRRSLWRLSVNDWHPIETVPHDRTVRVWTRFVGRDGQVWQYEVHATWSDQFGMLCDDDPLESEVQHASHWQEIVGPDGARQGVS